MGSDLVQEFSEAAAALEHAEELCAAVLASGEQASVIDLSEASTQGVLFRRFD